MHPFLVPLAAFALTATPDSGAALADSVLAPLREQARALAPLVHTDLARRFLAAAAALPPPPVRTVYRDSASGAYLSAGEVDSQPEPTRTRFKPRILDGLYYCQTRYGTILNDLRMIELLGTDGVTSLEGKRVLDFGYGRIGHLRVLASLGAAAVGVDVDPELRALFADPNDQGPVPGLNGRAGSVTPVDGSFPGDPATRAADSPG